MQDKTQEGILGKDIQEQCLKPSVVMCLLSNFHKLEAKESLGCTVNLSQVRG